MIWRGVRYMKEPRFIDTTYRGMTVREQKMLPAMKHLAERDHEFSPRTCEGCLEAAAFLTMPGYEGSDHPLSQ